MRIIAKTAFCTCILIFSLRCVTTAKQTKNLQDDLEDFQKLISIKEIVTLILKYIEEDEEFSNVIQYLLSDEFLRLVFFIDCTPEYINILKYVEFAGLPIHNYINVFYRFLSLPAYHSTQDIQGFQSEYNLGGLPKIKTRMEFKNFVMKIKDKRFATLLDAFTHNWRYKELLRKVKKKINTDAIIGFINRLITCNKY